MSIIKKEFDKIHMLNTPTPLKGIIDQRLINQIEKNANEGWLKRCLEHNFNVVKKTKKRAIANQKIKIPDICYQLGCYVSKMTDIDQFVVNYFYYLKKELGDIPLAVRIPPTLLLFIEEETNSLVCTIRSRIAKLPSLTLKGAKHDLVQVKNPKNRTIFKN